MPAGGSNYYILKALEDMLKKNGVELSTTELHSIYLDLKAGYENAGRDILVTSASGKMSLNVDFLKDVMYWGKTGTNPYAAIAAAPGPSTYAATTAVYTKKDGFDFGGAGGGGGQTTANNAASYSQMVLNWGMPISDTIQSNVDQAARQGWSLDRFLNYLRTTPEYQQRFPGITDQRGAIRFDEATYLAREQQYKDTAAEAGLNLGDKQQNWLFVHDVSPAEYRARASAQRALTDNPQLFEQFRAELIRTGVKASDITDASLFKTVMGEGNADWYHVWNMTIARNAVVDAGLQIAKGGGMYGALPRHLIKMVSDKGYDQQALDTGFAQVAEQFLTVLPESKIQGYGLSKKQILRATFGGPGATEIKLKMQRILAEQDALNKNELAAGPSYTNQQGGLTVAGADQQRGATA